MAYVVTELILRTGDLPKYLQPVLTTGTSLSVEQKQSFWFLGYVELKFHEDNMFFVFLLQKYGWKIIGLC